jgi:adenine-specific DNA methylase
MTEREKFGLDKGELLISKWFPITEVSVESVRERTPGTDYPPTSRIHVWFARRPLATSRAAILASLLPSEVRYEDILRLLGIPAGVNLRKAEEDIAKAKAAGIRLNYNPFSWNKAYTHTPSQGDLSNLHSGLRKLWGSELPLVVDPMAGGGSIPFEAMRLGLPAVAGDLNPVAFICLKGTLEYPVKFGKRLLPAVESFCKEIHEAAKVELEEFFPKQTGEKVYAYLWTRTIRCSSCGLTVPIAPNWWVVRAKKDEESVAVKVVINKVGDNCDFEIIKSPISHELKPNIGTTKGGQIECPRCHTVTSSEQAREEARNGRMGRQLYCVCIKSKGLGKTVAKWEFRAPTKEDYEALRKAEIKLQEKLPSWKIQNLVPDEKFPETANDTRPIQYGIPRWCDFFSPRQLLTHLTYLEKFLQAKKQMFSGRQRGSEEWDFAAAVTSYGAMVFDSCISYNCISSIWDSSRKMVRQLMTLQAFPFRSSYSEWNQLVSKGGYDWALVKVLDSLEEIIEFLPESHGSSTVYCGTATRIPLRDKSVPCVVVDPPYAANVMYAEVSDFFYVWLKRLLGDIFLDAFNTPLTEKEEETVANLARFKGMGRSAKKLAQEDYKTKMEACFREMHRILQDNGVMTVMFTHRTAEAWSSLATALMSADFTFISSWPVHTEPPDKYGKRGKGVLKVTILLTCRKRQANHPGIWEHIVEELRDVAKQKIEEFSKLGIDEPDLKVSVYGPVLGKFADYYPVKTATGKEIDPLQALDLVTDVLNEKFLQEAGIQTADRETAAYINLLATFPNTETEYEEARLATVFGGLVTLDTLDVKGAYGLIEKKGKNIRILSARDRQATGIIDPYDPKTTKTTIDNVHAAILRYERGGLIQVKQLMQEKNLDIAGSPFPTVLQAYARYAYNSSNENFRKDAAMANALLTALGKSIEFAPRKGERLDHYTSES